MAHGAGTAGRAATALLLLMVVGGCGARSASAGLSVTASIYPLSEFARRVGGQRAAVAVLVPPGVELHDFEPTPRDLATLIRTRLFIYNGAGLEPWVDKALTQLPETTVRVNATEGLPVVREGRAPDPHVWLDPVLAQQQVGRIRDGFTRADPAGQAVYEANATALTEDLRRLDARFTQVLGQCRRKEFITTHAAFGYLARRYGLRLVAVGGLSPEAEPPAGRIKAVVQEARRSGARVIYDEPRGERRVAQTIAREIGGTTAVLDPLESQTVDAQRAGKDYFTVMHENLDQLAQGLDCG